VLFSPVFAKLQQLLDHQPALPRSDVPSVRLLQAISFQAITHSFARRPAAIPFSINHFRTLFVLTEGVPSLHSNLAQLWCNLSPLESTFMDLPANVANKRLTLQLNPLDATHTKNRGGPSGTRHSAWSHNLVCAALPRNTVHGGHAKRHPFAFSSRPPNNEH